MKLTELLYPFAFLPVCLLLYYVLPKRCRNAALLCLLYTSDAADD